MCLVNAPEADEAVPKQLPSDLHPIEMYAKEWDAWRHFWIFHMHFSIQFMYCNWCFSRFPHKFWFHQLINLVSTWISCLFLSGSKRPKIADNFRLLTGPRDIRISLAKKSDSMYIYIYMYILYINVRAPCMCIYIPCGIQCDIQWESMRYTMWYTMRYCIQCDIEWDTQWDVQCDIQFDIQCDIHHHISIVFYCYPYQYSVCIIIHEY